MIRRYMVGLIQTAQGANNIVWDVNDIFMRSLYGYAYTSNYNSKHVLLTVALTAHKAMSLRHVSFDENMKGDSKLLLTEAMLSIGCFYCLHSCSSRV